MILSFLIFLAALGPMIGPEYPEFKIVINIPATRLYLYKDGEMLQQFKVAVGLKDYPTPIGKDKITQVIWNPWWYPPEDAEWAEDKEDTPPGPGNPLGIVKLVLSGDLRMHGTDQEASIGTPASHACVRMHNRDAKKIAWVLQSHLTAELDENLLKKYAANPEKSFHVTLGREVPVEFIYDPIDIGPKKIILYADIYSKIENKDKEEVLLNKLRTNGIDTGLLNKVEFRQILKKWKGGKTTQIERARLLNQKSGPQHLQSPPKTGPKNRSSQFWPAPKPASRHASWWPGGSPKTPPRPNSLPT